MSISLGSITLIPLSLQADPGMVSVRVLACQKEWEPTELEGKRFTLRAGHLDFHALPMKLRLEPFEPVDFRLDFPVQALSDPLLLRCARGLLLRHESLDLLKQPLFDPEERRALDDLCYGAWFERALGLELAYEPRKLRSGETNLETAGHLLEQYLHVRPSDEEALKSLDRVRFKKEMVRALHAGDWLRVRTLNDKIRALQPDWQGPAVDEMSPIEAGFDALKAGWLEVAEERFERAVADREEETQASLLLARMASAWRRDDLRSAEWYVRYFELGGTNEEVVHEAVAVLDRLGPKGVDYRGRLLAQLAERLVMRPNAPELAELVYVLAEAQSSAGVGVDEDFALLWACYEKSFEHQIAVDRRVERTLLERLQRLHERLQNDNDWLRIRRVLADFEPDHPEYREQLAKLLLEKGMYEEALNAHFALWLTCPEDVRKSEAVRDAAAKAGLPQLAERAAIWCELLTGVQEINRIAYGGPQDHRLLCHPELRPLAPVISRWSSESGGDEARRCMDSVQRLGSGVAPEQWRELENAAKALPLVPSLEAALIVRYQKQLEELHPLAVSARLTLDRFTVASAPSFGEGMQSLGLWRPGQPLFETRERDLARRRLQQHRLREIGKFFLCRLWDGGADPVLVSPLEQDPMADFLEAMYLHGMPDWTTRILIEDVARTRKISRQRRERMEANVKSLLRLSPAGTVTEF